MSQPPKSFVWFDNSCAYDSTLFIVYNTLLDYLAIVNHIRQRDNTLLKELARETRGDESLDTVKQRVRSSLHHKNPRDFPLTGSRWTSALNVMMELMLLEKSYLNVTRQCNTCTTHEQQDTHCSVICDLTIPNWNGYRGPFRGNH